eukprot:m.115874 g.115874  ORF g.115874 m.115874 type:complete len:635 (+) comp15505_c0_seq2:163-2067(+)
MSEYQEETAKTVSINSKAPYSMCISSIRLLQHLFGGADTLQGPTRQPSKQLYNQAETVVDEALEGVVSSSAGLLLLKDTRVVLRHDISIYNANHVVLLSGGGSGHEPAHVGYIGQGMLSGAICGDIFASPPPSAILAAILSSAGPKGVLLIVKNYTGDRLNFGLAAEQARSQGVKVDLVIVNDDFALPVTTRAGRRGLAGTVLVHKVAGAVAETGADLGTVTAAAKAVVAAMATVGVGLGPCCLPGRGPSFQLPDDEVELGLGIHGEAGVERIKHGSLDSLVTRLLGLMTTTELATEAFPIQDGDQVVVLINNLGGSSVLEMSLVAKAVLQALRNDYGCTILRVYNGSFMTSLAMPGFSVTLLKVDTDQLIHRMPMLQWLDYVTEATAWQPCMLARTNPSEQDARLPAARTMIATTLTPTLESYTPLDPSSKLYTSLQRGCERLVAISERLDQLDALVGDGDCGTTMKGCATRMLELLQDGQVPADLSVMCQTLGREVGEAMGGSSGAIYSILLTALASELQGQATTVKLRQLGRALLASLARVSAYGGAQEGDCTLLDVWYPVARCLKAREDAETVWKDVVAVAQQAADKTADMRPMAGRASYLHANHTQSVCDPGAVAASEFLSAAISDINV